MPRFTLHETVARSVEEVFDYVTQPRNRPEWQGSLKAVRDAPADVGKGTSWKDVLSGPFGEATVEIIEFERSQLYRERVASGAVNGTVTMSFEGHNGETRLTVTTELDMSGWTRYLKPILTPFMKREFKNDLVRLREILEGR